MSLETTTVVFAGPSLPPDTRTSVDRRLTWRPPASRGDLDGLDLPAGSRVVLIDGYLVQQHPPSPTEVLGLIDRGHEVWGCSSLGALRAAELRHHGVLGWGWVYHRLVDRAITFDDELVATLNPLTDEATGLFLANIRFGIEQLIADGRATKQQAHRLIDNLRSVHFEQRTSSHCRGLAMSAGLDASATKDLLANDVKQQDATTLITHLTTMVSAQ